MKSSSRRPWGYQAMGNHRCDPLDLTHSQHTWRQHLTYRGLGTPRLFPALDELWKPGVRSVWLCYAQTRK